MQKRFMMFGMVLLFSLSFWSCPAWSGEGSAIMAAILENDPSALQEALQSGVRLDVTDSHGHTPLDMALAHGNAFSAPGMVELLLRHGARPGPGPADPALTLARLLVTQAPSDQLKAALQTSGKVDAAMPNGLTAFLWAAAFAQEPAALEALVKAGADPRQVLPGGDARLGDNALLLAAEHNRNPEIVRFLLRNGLAVNSRSSMLGDSALMLACRANGNPAVAETLVRHGADVDMRNGVGCSAFLFAARRADGLALLRLLAERGADVRAVDDSLSNALHAACAGQGSPEAIRFLLSAGLPVNGRTGKEFGAYSPLMLAVRNDDPDAEVIRLLLQQGADPGLRDMDGNRAGDGLPAERISWLKRNGLAEILQD
ncbi:ankyrin repeat domain-containing protein [Desulfovibrio piger]|uniref:ankyrin repeat domain-containing protein n=1 Tax=Desulfovibrio piger TaxID=901 RepID=UPI00195D2B09|nr:ankyrin repeat domain-containing protein [Desulfovibrio piger]MBM6834494.1 ankyrin repeat domain-containing protein [Desulfovibrio piger]